MSHKQTHNFRGLIADTAEMPAIKANATPQPIRKPKVKAKGTDECKRRHPVLLAVLAIIGSFTLGLAIRMVVNIPSIISELSPVVPGLRSMASPQPIDPGLDILTELGKKIEVPIQVDQVLPFRMQNGSPRFTVLGGYLLKDDGQGDKSKPIMAVFATSDVSESVTPGSITIVNGYVVMANGAEQTAASVLKPEQESDLIYITERVNFWDRVTILGSDLRSYSKP